MMILTFSDFSQASQDSFSWLTNPDFFFAIHWISSRMRMSFSPGRARQYSVIPLKSRAQFTHHGSHVDIIDVEGEYVAVEEVSVSEGVIGGCVGQAVGDWRVAGLAERLDDHLTSRNLVQRNSDGVLGRALDQRDRAIFELPCALGCGDGESVATAHEVRELLDRDSIHVRHPPDWQAPRCAEKPPWPNVQHPRPLADRSGALVCVGR